MGGGYFTTEPAGKPSSVFSVCILTAQVEKLSEGKPRTRGQRGAWVSSAEKEVTHTGQERKQSDPPTRTTKGWRRWWGQGDYEKADGTSRVRGREKL